MEAGLSRFCAEEDPTGETVQKEPMEAPMDCSDGLGSGHTLEFDDDRDPSQVRTLQGTEETPDSDSRRSNAASDWRQVEVKGQPVGFEEKRSREETEKNQEPTTGRGDGTQTDWVTVGPPGPLEDSHSGGADVCFIQTSVEASEALVCQAVDQLSCVVLSGPEELLSRVIRITVRARDHFPFPVMVAVPFHARSRVPCRDVTVKIVDEERRASYVTPLTTEGVYGGRRGSFAQVKVYSFGVFAVVSCLRKESHAVPKRGLSHRLATDPRICLKYLPGSFSAPVIAQTMIQPIEAVLLTAVKSRKDAYGPVLSTSPLLHLHHPSSQTPRRPFSVTLPCPPNPEKRKDVHADRGPTAVGGPALHWDHLVTKRLSILGVPTKPQEMSKESLVALGWKEQQWKVLDKVVVRNQQKGLVTFDLMENFERLLALRLLSPLPPCVLTSLVEELQSSISCHSVTVVLQRRQDEPRCVLLAIIPSRELSWEMNKLRARGWSGPVDTSPEISLHEADVLVLRFNGNITSTAQNEGKAPQEWMAFHSQRKNHLRFRLTEVDPFGNHSSPHYKGTLLLHRVTRGQLEWQGDAATLKDTELPGEAACRLDLTLPKRDMKIDRPMVTDSLSDSLLLWLSGELSEEDVSLLRPLLRLRRSAARLVKLRAGNHLPSQVVHMLTLWRRGLPSNLRHSKASQLAHCLVGSGRPDLAQELLLRQEDSPARSSLR